MLTGVFIQTKLSSMYNVFIQHKLTRMYKVNEMDIEPNLPKLSKTPRNILYYPVKKVTLCGRGVVRFYFSFPWKKCFKNVGVMWTKPYFDFGLFWVDNTPPPYMCGDNEGNLSKMYEQKLMHVFLYFRYFVWLCFRTNKIRVCQKNANQASLTVTKNNYF